MTTREHAASLTLAPAPAVAASPEVVRTARQVPRAGRRAARRSLVVRDRLLRALVGSGDAPLRVIVAPAGYGKTTTLGQWAARDLRPFAWVTADQGHDDPVRLLRDIVAALDAIEPVGDAVQAALTTSRPAIATDVLPALGQSLAAVKTPFVLVLDDVEAVEGSESLAALGALSALLPAGCVLALASRREPALPLGRLRAQGEVVELRARDLAMTRGEAGELLAAAGVQLDAEQVALLVERTEGWPAGLYLAALALREQDDLAGALARFAGDDRLVADYLRDELLAELPPSSMRFLTRTSPLDELSGPLCDAVLGARGSGRLLRDLGRSNLLLSALDRSEERFHCHPLLAEALRAELRRFEPEREAEAHRRAGNWYERHGDVEHAIEHAIAAGDAARAGELIWRAAPAYAAYGRKAALERWMGHFTAEQVGRHPELALVAATLHAIRGDGDMVERYASVAAGLLDAAPVERRDGLEAAAAVMRATVAGRGTARLREDAAHASVLVPEQSPWRAQCCLLMGTADLFSGNRAEGRRWLEEGSRRGAMAAPVIQVDCLALLALVAAVDDAWEDASRLAEVARAQVERVGLGEYAASALVYAVSALVRAHRGRAVEAHDDVRLARRLLAMRAGFSPLSEGATLIALARADLRLGDVLGARALLAECERAAHDAPDAIVLQAWLEDAWSRADAFVDDIAGPSALTTAELRVLRFLPSHRSFREIAAELGVSANTVKTQAHALYRKLDASSRSEAVARATQLGLLDA